ncbi:MAG: MFS transporter [Alphaproteobacteria bacterium]|nr:MFS transporter [Alphaproteobacteria bacterium]
MTTRLQSRVALAFSSVGHSYAHIAMLLFPTVVLGLEPVFHMPYGDLVLLAVTGNILFGAAALPAGWLGDRWSAVGMMGVFFFGTGGAAVVTGFARTPLEIGLGLAGIGLFASIYHPVGIAWLVRTSAKRGRALGFNGLFGSIGTAAAAVIAGTLTEWYGWRSAFIVPGITLLLVGAAFVVAIRLGWIVEGRDLHADEAPPPRDDMVRVFWVLSFTMLVTGLLWQVTQWAMPKLFVERMPTLTGGGVAMAGGLVSLVFLVSAVSTVVGGYLADRFRLRSIYILGYWAQVPAMLGLGLIVGPALLPFAALAVFVSGINAPAENALLARYSPKRWQATAFGAKFVLSLGVAAGSTALVGIVHNATGSFTLLFLGIAAVSCLAGLLARHLPRGAGLGQRAAVVPAAAE